MKFLAVTGGHSFDREAFGAFLDALGDSLTAEVTWVEQPEALQWLTPERLDGYDASLHYDMPGARPTATQPPPELADGIARLTAAGHGFVVMHHAIASWPGWAPWSELVGGQYLYRPGTVRGQDWPDSGYMADVPQHLTALDPEHPVLAGLADGLDVVDEPYLCPVFEADVHPLLRTDAPRRDVDHHSTVAAVAEGVEVPSSNGDWTHPDGSSLAAWTRINDRSRLVYIQPGDKGRTLGEPRYRRLVSNALGWVADHRAG